MVMTDTDKKLWRSVDNFPEYQICDGNGHLAYYDSERLLSFIWDGKAEWIEVSHGGYAEPVTWIIPAFIFAGSVGDVIDAFELYCLTSLDEWDETVWDDDQYSYHEGFDQGTAMHKRKGIPQGKPYVPLHGWDQPKKIWGSE